MDGPVGLRNRNQVDERRRSERLRFEPESSYLTIWLPATATATATTAAGSPFSGFVYVD